MEELHEALKTSKLPASDIAAVMANIDMNDSGAIDYEEFLAATLHASKVSSDEHLKRAFAEFDDDNSGACLHCHVLLAVLAHCRCQCAAGHLMTRSLTCLTKLCVMHAGTITVDELIKVLEKVGGTDTAELREILTKVDKNKDGSIDYAEFVEMMAPPSDGPVRRRDAPAIKF